MMAEARYSKEKGFDFLFGWAYPKKHYRFWVWRTHFFIMRSGPPVAQFDEFSAML
jgi:hypothetical protein